MKTALYTMYSISHSRIDNQQCTVLWPLKTWEGRHLSLGALSIQPEILGLSKERQMILKCRKIRELWIFEMRTIQPKLPGGKSNRKGIFENLGIPLPCSCTAFSQTFTVNWFRLRIRNELSPRTTCLEMTDLGAILRPRNLARYTSRGCSLFLKFREMPFHLWLEISGNANWNFWSSGKRLCFYLSVSILFRRWTSTRTY